MERKITIEESVPYTEDYQNKMLEENQVEGLLEMHGRGMDDKSCYDYDVSRKVSSQCELYSDGSGVYFLHRRKVLFLLLSTERKKSVGRISPSERISGEMCRLSG